MNKEIEYLLNEMKDTTQDYIGTNGCKYQDLLREEIDLLLSYIEQLEKIPNKALDFIHKNSYKKGDGTIMYDVDIQELENILKGDSE